jgi:hypothetical protein
MAGWPTPTAVDRVRNEETLAKCAAFRKRNANQNTVPMYLGEVASMAGWPTPTVGNAQGSQMAKDASSTGRRPDGSKATVSLNQVASMAGWNTPRATDGSNGGPNQAGGALPADAAKVAGWATPSTRDWKDTGGEPGRLDPDETRPVAATGDAGGGAWSDFYLVPCLDGKARRVGSGLFPLAHGATARVGRLRAYGNAIVPQVAAEFVTAWQEATWPAH